MDKNQEIFYFRIYYFRLPFAYSLLNEEISQFHNGPIVNMSSKCCNSSCVERTGLELSWWLHQDKKNSNIKYVVSDANPSNKSL